MRKILFILLMAIPLAVFAHDYDQIPTVGGGYVTQTDGGTAGNATVESEYYSGGAAIGIATDHHYDWTSFKVQGSIRGSNYNYVNAGSFGVAKMVATGGGNSIMLDAAVGKAFGADTDTLSISGGVAWKF